MKLKLNSGHLWVERRKEPVLGELLDDCIVIESGAEGYKKGDIVVVEEVEKKTKFRDGFIVHVCFVLAKYE